MNLIFTISGSKPQNFDIKSIEIGDRIKVEYITSEGKKMVYWINVTNNEKLVMS